MTSVIPVVIPSRPIVESAVRWHGAERSVEYALFSKSGFTPDLLDVARDREDLWLFTPSEVLELF